jgi:pyridoxamine 5'-phosphate oxidase-like protein
MTQSITHERAPEREHSLVADKPGTTSWDTARERLANPENQRTNWLATVRPDGRPHLMPVIAFWFDGAFHFVVGEGTRKGRNLAADSRCVIGTNSTTLPSLDVIAEGRAEPLTDEDSVRRIAERFNSSGWPLEARGDEVFGPNAPTAGPPPYRIFRMVPSRAFGLPGTYGMDQFDQADLPRPTRWDFAAD